MQDVVCGANRRRDALSSLFETISHEEERIDCVQTRRSNDEAIRQEKKI